MLIRNPCHGKYFEWTTRIEDLNFIENENSNRPNLRHNTLSKVNIPPNHDYLNLRTMSHRQVVAGLPSQGCTLLRIKSRVTLGDRRSSLGCDRLILTLMGTDILTRLAEVEFELAEDGRAILV